MSTSTCKDGRTITWSGAKRCMDFDTGHVFNSVSAFNFYRSRVKKHGLKNPAEFGMVKNEAGYWVTRLPTKAERARTPRKTLEAPQKPVERAEARTEPHPTLAKASPQPPKQLPQASLVKRSSPPKARSAVL
jgi:hypothetical protein